MADPPAKPCDGAFAGAPSTDFWKKKQTAPGRTPLPAAARAAEKDVCFATALIAAKPVKPCDRGVFAALNLLLIQERASGKSGRVQP